MECERAGSGAAWRRRVATAPCVGKAREAHRRDGAGRDAPTTAQKVVEQHVVPREQKLASASEGEEHENALNQARRGQRLLSRRSGQWAALQFRRRDFPFSPENHDKGVPLSTAKRGSPPRRLPRAVSCTSQMSMEVITDTFRLTSSVLAAPRTTTARTLRDIHQEPVRQHSAFLWPWHGLHDVLAESSAHKQIVVVDILRHCIAIPCCSMQLEVVAFKISSFSGPHKRCAEQ